MPAVDLNVDLAGARWSEVEAMLDLATSASVPCGPGVGGPGDMRRICQTAVDRGVSIGAQVVSADHPRDLRDAVLYQLGALDGFAQVAGAGVMYVKAHGELYESCLVHAEHAEAVVEAAHEYDPAMAVVGPPGSTLLAIADELGMEPVAEAWADRDFLPDGRLAPLDRNGAAHLDPAILVARAVALVTQRSVAATDGSSIDMRVRSIRLPCGTPNAADIARSVRAGLEAASVGVHPFAL